MAQDPGAHASYDSFQKMIGGMTSDGPRLETSPLQAHIPSSPFGAPRNSTSTSTSTSTYSSNNSGKATPPSSPPAARTPASPLSSPFASRQQAFVKPPLVASPSTLNVVYGEDSDGSHGSQVYGEPEVVDYKPSRLRMMFGCWYRLPPLARQVLELVFIFGLPVALLLILLPILMTRPEPAAPPANRSLT